MRVPHFLLIVFCFVLSSTCMAQSSTEYRHHLMPVPAHVEFHSGRMAIDATFAVSTDAPQQPALNSAIAGMVRRHEGRTGYQMPTGAKNGSGARLVIHCKGLST